MNDQTRDSQTAMLREWYRDVVKHAAFIFVEDTTDSGHFLTIHMTQPQPRASAAGRPRYLTAGESHLESLRKALEANAG